MKTFKKLMSLFLLLFIVYSNLNIIDNTRNVTKSDIHMQLFEGEDDISLY